MKLDLILENIRNKYNLGLLEEASDMSEKDLLAGKILINESTMAIRKMLIEEGVMANVRDILEENWTAVLFEESSKVEKKDSGENKKLTDDALSKKCNCSSDE